jgi:hypothetical protein
MTPHDLHYGLAAAKWQQRAEVLRAAYAAHPERFPRGLPLPPPLPTATWINKPTPAGDRVRRTDHDLAGGFRPPRQGGVMKAAHKFPTRLSHPT